MASLNKIYDLTIILILYVYVFNIEMIITYTNKNT